MDVEIILSKTNLSAIETSVIGELSTGINSIIGTINSIAENTTGLDSIVGSMSSIEENTV